MWSCTCHTPPTVDLTEALAASAHKHDNQSSFKAEPLLRETLSQYGWCLVSIDLAQLPGDSILHSIQPLKMKQQVENLFDPRTVASTNSKTAVYRGRMAERSVQEEPKQSWEVKRCCQDKTDLPIAHEWARALHSVAVAVTRVLQLPPNVLLKETDCDECCSHDNNPCTIDLLRVFLYDAVNHDTKNSLGSSPHTDWGSWTVVWQDDVGGLQTYCHSHRQWVDVPVPPLEESRVYFVVHVGDVTSLAMVHAVARESIEDAGSPPSAVVWPSPRHRVLSPTNSIPRTSLVYFAYPPLGISLKDMETSLLNYTKTDFKVAVPYSEYFVLQDQSKIETASTSSAKETYRSIQLLSLDKVFAEKWQQVQR